MDFPEMGRMVQKPGPLPGENAFSISALNGRMSGSELDHLAQVAASESREVRKDFKQTLLSGLALTVPFFITVLVLLWVTGWVRGMLEPLVSLLNALGLTHGLSDVLTELAAATLVFGVIVIVGLAAQHGPNTHLRDRFDVLMEDLPGIGSIYTSVERMSDVIVEGDTDSFQEVKLVEFPQEQSYSLAFLTANPTEALEAAVGGADLVTVYVPLAPNPVMGGHLVNLPRDRVYDVDLSVEEGMEAIMTTGVAIDEAADDSAETTD